MGERDTHDGDRDGDGRATLGVVSDTHGWLDPELIEIFDDYGAEAVVHAGDVGDPEVLDELGEIGPVHAVRGNIDGGELRRLPEEELFEFAGRRVAVRHIAGNPRRPKREALDLIDRETPDVLIVGHSHIPAVDRVDGTLWINPGAAGREGFHDHRLAAMLHVDEAGELGMDRIELGPRSSRGE